MKSISTQSAGQRRGKRFALDPRLVIGLALVAVSVVGVWGVVAAADETIPVYVATRPLAPGDRVRADDLVQRNVKIDDADTLYLVAGDIPDAGVVITRPVSPGELVPFSAVGRADSVRLASIVLSVDGQVASAVVPGATVDLWASREGENGEFGVPSAVVTGAVVVRLVASEGIVGAGETTAVELLVPRARLARLLESVANDDEVSIVPATIPSTR
ncbi:flagellar protein FlgA [soil metagenome]